MPKFSTSAIKLSQPTLSVTAEATMDCEQEGLSRIDSPSPRVHGPAVNSPKGSHSHNQESSATLETPISEPLATSVFEGQVILGGRATEMVEVGDGGEDELSLPLALTAQQFWITEETRQKIEEACAGLGNLKCRHCSRKFSSTRRLKVHAPQHYINVFCPCGEFSYQRDYVLRHQRISRCHTGRIFSVDEASYPEFRNLILPHVGDPRKRASLALGFPACRPLLENSEDVHTADRPVVTQPLRVMLARIDNKEPTTSSQASRPMAAKKRRTQGTGQPLHCPASTVSQSGHCLHEAEVYRLRRHLRRLEDDMSTLRRRMDRLKRGNSGHRH